MAGASIASAQSRALAGNELKLKPRPGSGRVPRATRPGLDTQIR
jgi:hypothetical protein